MWKISYFLLFLIAFDNCLTFESPRLKETEAVRNNRNNNRKYQLDIEQKDYEDYNSPEESEEYQGGKLIGRWRSNGEAIEPKWRDGDSIPLVPFEEAATRRKPTPKPKEKSSNNGRDIINHASSTSKNKYRETQDDYDEKKQPSPSTTNIKTIREFIPPSRVTQNYGRIESHESLAHNDYTNIPRNGSRRYRTRKQKPMDLSTTEKYPAINYEREPVQQTPSSSFHETDEKISPNDPIKLRFDSNNYRNLFQLQPNDYELNNEEYHRPRSRKRRPPQNYEYVETKTPYPSLDYWQKSSNTSSSDRNNNPRLNNSPNVNKKNSDNSELKSLLKMQQIEGLSLSEILQRRNLTLSDLLERKMETINALRIHDEQETGHHGLVEKKIVQTQPVINRQRASSSSSSSSPSSSERPRWMTNRRVRIKEMRRNPLPTTTTTTTTTTINNIFEEITNDNNNKTNETIELSVVDNDGKSRDNEKLSTVNQQIKTKISSRFNYTTTKPIIATTTAIKSTSRESFVINDSEKGLTTLQTTDDEEIMEFSDFAEKKSRDDLSPSTTIESTTIIKPETTTNNNDGPMIISKYNDIDKDLGSTLSIEHILLTEPTTISTLTTTIIQSDVNKSNTLIEYNKTENDAESYDANEMEYQNDGPRDDELMGQMSVNFSESKKIREEDQTSINNSDESLGLNHQLPSTNNKIYERVLMEIEPEARAEIFELISTGASGQRLEELLKSRNMSIDELISLRQRGSSRVHLADLSRLRSRSNKYKTRGDQTLAPIEKLDNNRDKLIDVNLTDVNQGENQTRVSIYTTLDDINEQMDKINETQRRFIIVDKTPIIIKISSRDGKEKKTDRITQRDPKELEDLLNVFESLPFAIYNNYSLTTTAKENDESTELPKIKNTSDDVTKDSEITINTLLVGLAEEELSRENETSHEILSTTSRDNYAFIPSKEDKRKTLSKVRPSIIASGAILGMTIVGFLAIFIICRIRQKQKYIYKNTFSKAVFQTPAVNARKLSNSSSLNTIMVNVVATSTAKRAVQHETQEVGENFESKSDIDNDSLDANDSWDTIPDFMK